MGRYLGLIGCIAAGIDGAWAVATGDPWHGLPLVALHWLGCIHWMREAP